MEFCFSYYLDCCDMKKTKSDKKNSPNTKENSISIQYARKIRFVLYINEKMDTNLTFRGVDKKS